MAFKITFNHKDFPDDLIRKSLSEILEGSVLFSVASIKDSNQSWINTAYFAYSSNLVLYFLTPPTAQHSKNVEKNDSVAVSIFDSHQISGDKRGLQIFGKCHRAKGEEVQEGIDIYGSRFSWFSKTIKSPEDFDKSPTESRIYVIVPNRVKIFDEVLFGPEKWVTVSL